MAEAGPPGFPPAGPGFNHPGAAPGSGPAPGYPPDPGYGAAPGYGPHPGWVVAPSEGWVAPKGFTPDGRRVAEPGRRVLGFLVDLAIWTGPQVLVIVVIAVVIFAASSDAAADGSELPASTVIAIIGLYGLVFLLSIAKVAVEAEKVCRSGQTWGMKALRLRAIDGRTGGSVSRGRAWGRAAFAAMVSGQLFGIGYWWAFFDDRKRTLHDLVTSTVVIDER